MPTLHTFSSTRDAYDASQTNDAIRNGDVLHVPNEGAIAVLLDAWPTAIDAAHAGEAFHVPGFDDWAAVPGYEGSTDCSASYALALTTLNGPGCSKCGRVDDGSEGRRLEDGVCDDCDAAPTGDLPRQLNEKEGN